MSPTVKGQRRTTPARQERSVATRQALLDACARRLASSGYAATTTAAIAEEAGVSRGALQYSFTDRTSLMLEVVRVGYGRLVAELRDAPIDTGDTVHARVVAHIDTMLRAYGAPHATAAYEVLMGERSNPTFLREHADLLRSAEADLDELWLDTFADTNATTDAIRAARRVARAAVLGLVLRSAPLGADDAVASALATAVAALLEPIPGAARSKV